MPSTGPSRQIKTAHPLSIAIIGSGAVGATLARSLVNVGHKVSIANSRGPQSLQQVADETGAKAIEVQNVVTDADIVVLAVPMSSIPPLSSTLHIDCILLDTCNYYPSRDGRIQALDEGRSDSVWVAEQFTAAVVVKAFNNILAADIATSARPQHSSKKVALPVASDDQDARHSILRLVDEIGFDAYDAGPLSDSWRFQPGQPAYCTEPTLIQLPSLLAKADQKQGPISRDRSRALMERLPLDFPPQRLRRVARLSVGMDMLDVRSWIAALLLAFTLLWRSVIRR